MNTTTRDFDVEELINRRVSPLSYVVAALATLVLCVDGFNTLDISYVMPQIARQWQIDHVMVGQIFSAGIAGLLAGYLLLAPCAGRFGQKRVVIFSTALFGILSLLTTFAANPWLLIVLRFITGIGLGGAIPSAVALTGEFSPKRRRSTFITIVFVGITIGQSGAGLVASALLKDYGWQSVLYVGAALALGLAGLMAMLLPESVDFLVNRGADRPAALAVIRRIDRGVTIAPETRLRAGEGNAEHIRLTQLFQDGRTVGTVALWFGLAMNLMVLTVLQSWLPTIFIDAGLGQEMAIRAASIALAGGLVAAFTVGPLMDRYGPYVVVWGLLLLGTIATPIIGLATALPLALIVLPTFIASFCNSGVQKSSNALAVYFYPTALRSAGLGWALGIGRIGAFIGPLAVGYMLQYGSTPSMIFYVMGVPMLLGAIAFLAMGRRYGRGETPAAAPLAQAAE